MIIVSVFSAAVGLNETFLNFHDTTKINHLIKHNLTILGKNWQNSQDTIIFQPLTSHDSISEIFVAVEFMSGTFSNIFLGSVVDYHNDFHIFHYCFLESLLNLFENFPILITYS